MRNLILAVCGPFLIGCSVTPQVTWSPDGETAVYQQSVLDSKGKKVDDLGQSGVFDGNATWSADSSSLYFIKQEMSGADVPVTALRRWVGDADADKQITPVRPLATGYPRTNLYLRHDGKTARIATLWPTWVLSLAVSADQRWLLINGIDVTPGAMFPAVHLWALQLQSKKLYVLSDSAIDPCFTGPNRVAYVEPQGLGTSVGQVLEVSLDESLAPLKPAPLLTVLCNSTDAIAGTNRDLLVMTAQATFPAPATQPTSEKIYAVGRDSGQIHDLASASMGFMSLSPDGKRILFIRPTDQGPPELCVMNIDGTQIRTLMDLIAFPNGLPIKPSWHGNDRVRFAAVRGTFVPPERNAPPAINVKSGSQGESHVVYDIVDYQIPLTGPMKPVQTISRDWAIDAKPSTLLTTTQTINGSGK